MTQDVLVRDGVIEINALPFSMHTEAYSQDELAHLTVGRRVPGPAAGVASTGWRPTRGASAATWTA